MLPSDPLGRLSKQHHQVLWRVVVKWECVFLFCWLVHKGLVVESWKKSRGDVRIIWVLFPKINWSRSLNDQLQVSVTSPGLSRGSVVCRIFLRWGLPAPSCVEMFASSDVCRGKTYNYYVSESCWFCGTCWFGWFKNFGRIAEKFKAYPHHRMGASIVKSVTNPSNCRCTTNTILSRLDYF